MPGGDRTGPMGMGAMTGRAAGFCAGYGAPGYTNAVGGRGGGFWGRGRGRGGGWGRGPWFGGVAAYPAYGPVAPMTATREQELEGLRQQAAHFQGALEDIQKRIEELQADSASK